MAARRNRESAALAAFASRAANRHPPTDRPTPHRGWSHVPPNDTEFSGTVKRAKLLVEHAYELDLRTQKPVGAIFALKNMGWSDKQEVEVQSRLGKVDIAKLLTI